MLYGIGLANLNLKNYPLAIDHFKQALAIAKEQDDREAEANARYRLGVCYARTGQTGAAQEQLDQALKMARQLGNAGLERSIVEAIDWLE